MLFVTVHPSEDVPESTRKAVAEAITRTLRVTRHAPADTVHIFFDEIAADARIAIHMQAPYSACDTEVDHAIRRVIGDSVGPSLRVSLPHYSADRVARGGVLQATTA